MARTPVPPSKNLAEQESKRAAKSNNSTVINKPIDSAKEKKVAVKKVAKPEKKKVIPIKKIVKDKVKPAVKKEKEKPVEVVPMTDKQITDAILEDVKEKEDVKKGVNIVVESPAVVEPILETEQPTKSEPEPEVSLALINDGEDIDKPFVPFPKTEMTNTTTLMVNAYKIDCPKLPSTVLDSINLLNTTLTSYLKEGKMELIAQLQAQDGVASQLLGKYVTDKGLVTAPVAGGIPAASKSGIQVNSAEPLPSVEYKIPEFLANNPTNGSPAQIMQIDQQGLADRIVTDINYAKKCANDLVSLAKNTFQFLHWGYVPLNVINEMIATTNNQFKYEVVKDVVDFKNSYVKVISPEGVVETEKFAIQ